jgi:two-component system, NtrC family, sensor kinase
VLSTVGRRLGAAFAAVLALFAAALVVMLVSLGRIGAAEEEVAALDHAKHAGHNVAALVREQYIHQAHTIIHNDLSHLGHYSATAAVTRDAAAHLVTLAHDPEETRLATAIAGAVIRADERFREHVVVGILRADQEVLRAMHDGMEHDVEQVVADVGRLNARVEARSEAARGRADDTRRRARLATVICFALASLLAAGVGILLARAIARPIAALRDGVRRVGAGDLTARVPEAGGEELEELGRALNQMTGDLARHQETQRLASIGQVAAGVAHEINNPIGVILGYVKLMRREGDREELAIVEDEARQCQRIVQGLLELARPPRLEPVAVDLAELAREVIERMGADVTVPAGLRAPARADEDKLRQVIRNVVSNAVDAVAGKPGGRVEISGGPGVLEVIDNGAGMTDEVRRRIFEPFFTTKKTGTGLGLPMAQLLVEAHGGKLEVLPHEAGTRVRIGLPT